MNFYGILILIPNSFPKIHNIDPIETLVHVIYTGKILENHKTIVKTFLYSTELKKATEDDDKKEV